MSTNSADSPEFLNSLADGVVVHDAETRAIERVNDSFCEMFEAERQELVGTNVHMLDAGPPPGEDDTPEELIEQARTEGSVTFERRMKTQTGGVLPVEIHLSWLTDEDSLVATVREIQARKDRQQRLHRYKQLVEQAPEMMMGVETDGTLLFANEELRQTLDIDEQSVAGLSVEDVLSAERTETLQPVLDRVFAGDTVTRTVQRTTQEGDDRWYHVRSYPLDQRDEMDDSVVVTIDDITDRKRHKQTIRDQRAFIQSTFDALEDVFYVFDTEGTLVEYNDRLSEVTGYDPDELAEMQPWDFFGPDERPLIKHTVANVLHNESEERVEGNFLTKSGKGIPYEFSAAPYYTGTGEVAGFVGIGRDTTEHKELEIQQRRYQQAIESSGDLIAAVDNDGTYLFANQAYCEYHGLGDAQVRGRSARQVIGHEQYETVEPYLEAALDGETTHYEMNRVHPDRGERTLDIRYYPLYDQDDRIQGVVAAMRDITERKEREEELHIKTRAMEESPVGIVITDPTREDNPIIYANRSFEEVTGYENEEIRGQNCRFLQGEGTRNDPVSTMREAIDAEKPVSVELRNYRKDGTMFWNDVSIAPVRNDDGELTHFVGFQDNVTDRKRQEHDLRLFKKAVEEAGHAVLITDRDGIIEYVNPAFENQTGYSLEEAVGKTPSLLKSGKQDEQFYEELWETILSGDIWEGDLTNKSKSGKLYQIDQTIAPITDDQGEITHFVAIESDTTDRQLREQHLAVLNRIFRHNLRNTLTVIKGRAHVLRDVLDGDQRASAEAIFQRADDLEQVSEKADSVRQFIERDVEEDRVCNVGTVLDDVADDIRQAHPGADITIGETSTSVAAASDMLALALLEILENAIVHADQSEPSVGVTVDDVNDHVEIAIADTGPGISEAERTAIERDEGTQLNHSSGIGLWLAHYVVTEFGGEVRITDNEPRGSVVRVRLPTVETS